MYIGVDVGGTFTDIAIDLDDGSGMLLHKLASTPGQPERAILVGLTEHLAAHQLSAADTTRLAHGTTVGTNALIQRQHGKVAIVTSEGFRDLLEIGRQTRPLVYDMHTDHPAPVVERSLRFEVPQRRLADGTVHVPLDEAATRRVARQLREQAVDSVVVCFLHSYAYPDDENQAAQWLREDLPPSVTVLTSSSVYPEFREYERFSTAVLNAALITIVGTYLDRLTAGTATMAMPGDVKICQSSGGVMSARMARQLPVRASLSGPAAGVQGASWRATAAGYDNIITLDVGGTSADVSLLVGGRPVEVNERDLAGFPIRLPSLDVNAVGAGGGSIAWIDRDGLLKVGPKSAGADPGPACYDQGGEQATVTDANVFLGRLNGDALLDGRMPIRKELATRVITELAMQIKVSDEQAALGIIQVTCATMVKAIRSVSAERGHDPREFVLFVFGGAGPLHAIDVAREMGINRVIVPPNPGILCAEGALNAPLQTEFVQTLLTEVNAAGLQLLRAGQSELLKQASDWFADEAIPDGQQGIRWAIGARYLGQNYELSLSVPLTLDNDALLERLNSEFHQAHELTYGFASQAETIQLVNLTVRATGQLAVPEVPSWPTGQASMPAPSPTHSRIVIFTEGQQVDAPVYRRESLLAGQCLMGPAIVEQMDTTVLVFPDDTCAVDPWGNLVIDLHHTESTNR
ncbi:MAG: hydantoinase/oxoprolinase family protein [Burkholderiaceae bacterium]